jgi:glycogen synthase
LQAADFGLMPSLYEPFGMVSEFYFHGAVVIGRATGGIVQQVLPLGSVASFTDSVCGRAARWHETSAPPTGFLFREPDGIATAEADWRAINEAGYDPSGGDPDRVTQRARFPLFQAMVATLQSALHDTTTVYRDRPDLHARMLAQGVSLIEKTFTWERAARRYADMMID